MSAFQPLLRSLIVSVVLPLIAVQVMLHAGRSPVLALAVAAVFPLGDGLLGVARRRGFDPIGALVVASIAVGIALSLITGNARFALAQGSLVPALFGLACLASLATPQPLIFRLARRYAGGEAGAAMWDARWDIPRVRAAFRLLTTIWGAGFVAEAILRTCALVVLAPGTAATVSYALDLVVLGGLIAFTLVRARRGEAALAAAGR